MNPTSNQAQNHPPVPRHQTATIEPEIEAAAPRVSKTTPKEKAEAPRVRSTTTNEPAAALSGPTLLYISQDDDEEDNEPRPRYNT